MQMIGQRVAAPVARQEQRVASTSRPSVCPVVINASAFGVKKTASQLLRDLGRCTSARKSSRPAVTGALGSTSSLDLVFVAAEVAPWSKTGGLGDVVGGLPIELVKRGHRVMTIAPRYDQYADAWDTAVSVNIMGETVRYFHSIKKGVHRVWVDHPWFLAKVWGKTGSKLYGPRSGADYMDNHKRFTLFCKAAIEAARVLPFGPGEDCVFVANDWHAALIPVLLKDEYKPKGEFLKAKTVLTIHNIAFQGRMWEDTIKDMELPQSSFEKLAFTDGYPKVYTETTPMEEDEKTPITGKTYKKINWLKGGILSADKLVTVSPNYAAEISVDAAGGVELDGAIRAAGGIEGIVNGMDIEEWNPKTDKFLTLPYDHLSVYAGKASAKEALQ
ncbi:Granule-bound starch synthase 1, chloroplastic/amyloplastic, partial [Tetrabaena socialis]